jgi:hypothetical protein
LPTCAHRHPFGEDAPRAIEHARGLSFGERRVERIGILGFDADDAHSRGSTALM